eukprot:g68786.t1
MLVDGFNRTRGPFMRGGKPSTDRFKLSHDRIAASKEEEEEEEEEVEEEEEENKKKKKQRTTPKAVSKEEEERKKNKKTPTRTVATTKASAVQRDCTSPASSSPGQPAALQAAQPSPSASSSTSAAPNIESNQAIRGDVEGQRGVAISKYGVFMVRPDPTAHAHYSYLVFMVRPDPTVVRPSVSHPQRVVLGAAFHTSPSTRVFTFHLTRGNSAKGLAVFGFAEVDSR